MPIYDVMLAGEPAPDALRDALAGFFDVEPGAVQPIGEMIGGAEGSYAMTVIYDVRPLSGDFALALTISAKPEVKAITLAAHLATECAVAVLITTDPRSGKMELVQPDGGQRTVTLKDTEDVGEVVIA